MYKARRPESEKIMEKFTTIVGNVKIEKGKDGYSVHDDECFICGTSGINEEKFNGLVNRAMAHNTDKENILKVRYDKKINQHVDVLAKHFIAANAGLDEKELFEEIDGKLVFVYDEESGGEIEMTFGEDERGSFIQVSADYVIDIKTINEILEDNINWIEV